MKHFSRKKAHGRDIIPAFLRDGPHFVSRQFAPQTRGQALIQKDAHSGCLRNGCKHRVGGLFKERNGLFARNGGKVLQKLIKTVAGFEVVEQVAHGHPRAGEARSAAHNFWVNFNNAAFLHKENLT